MPIQLTQLDYDISRQTIRNTKIKINLLNFYYQTVDSIEGNVVSGSISFDADADIRRTCTINMTVIDSTFNISPGNKIWLDKYIQIYIGVESMRDGEISWNNRGIYIINDPTITYDTSTKTLEFQAVDLMAKLTGLRNGYIDGVTTIITAGSSIREVMISTLEQMTNFKKYLIEDNPQKVPYELKFERSSTVYNILSTLRDITPGYEIFFDLDGIFRYQKIPSGNSDPIIADNTIWDYNVVSVVSNTPFSDVKNSIQVYGHSHDPSIYIDAIQESGDTYSGTATGVEEISPYIVIGFVANNNLSNPKLKINNIGPYPILNEDGTPAILNKPSGTYYVVQMNDPANSFLYLGTQQIFASTKDTNENSPFYVNGTTGEILMICTGGEYENIWTDDLARQRAEYELYLHDRLNDSIELTSVPIYWLDVNTKIEYVNKDIGMINELWNVQTQSYDLPSHFIIKKISYEISTSGKMILTCARFYPLYPWL